MFCITLILLAVMSQSVNGQNWSTGTRDIKWQMNCDFPGHDIDMISTSGPNCGNVCIASRECTHFRQTPSGICFLKKIFLSTPRSAVDGGMCGFIPWKFDSGRDHWNADESGVKWLINCDFPGHDIVQVKTTAEKCGGTCLANPQCNHYRHIIDGTCFLKKAPLSISRIPTRDGMCGFIPSRDFNNNNAPQSVTDQNWIDGARDIKWQMNCDFHGYDIDRISSAGENCGNICIASRECTHFRHAPDGFCYLKTASLSTPLTITADGICGFVPWKFDSERDHWNTEKSGIKWLVNCDFSGHDIGRVLSTGEQCGGICMANSQCSHFRFSPDGFCYIKKAPLSTIRTAINGGACGFIPSRNLDRDNFNDQEVCECVCE